MHGPNRNMRDIKAKNFKGSFKKLLPYLKNYLGVIIIALVLSVIGSICSVLGPKFLMQVTKTCMSAVVGNGIDFNEINKLGFILIGLYLSSAFCTYICSFIMTGVTQKISKKLRTEISEKINRLPFKYFDSRSYGDVLSRVTNDIDSISQNLNQSITQLISSITMFIGVLVMMISLSLSMTLIAIVSIPLSMILMMIVIKHSQKYFRSQQKSLGQLNGHIEESYSGHSIIKVFNQEEAQLMAFEELNLELKSSAWKSQFLSGLMMPIMMFVGNLSYIAVCIVGGILCVTSPTVGVEYIQGFIQYTRMLNQPIQQIGQITNVLQSCAAAAERVFEFLEEKEMEIENPKCVIDKKDIIGNIEFKEICFGYNDDVEIIHNFNCDVKKGQKIAIVGPTGAGKTTIVNLLMRFYEVNSGEITIDGTPISDISRENVAKLFGMVLQDTWLFEGTILDNLKFGNQNATLKDVEDACKSAHISHFINSLPGGLNYVLDETANISQGQKQLITIARAMVENAPMLILDEATSSVDTRTEILIQKAMDELMKGRTSFVIAHRLSTIKNADSILVLKDGNVIEQGNHDFLMSKNGFYAELYNSQFQE